LIKKIAKHIRAGTLLAALSEIKEARRNERKIQQEIADTLSLPDERSLVAAEQIIKKYFRYPLSVNYGLTGRYIKDLTRFIVTRRKGELLPEDQYTGLLERTEEIFYSSLSCHDWKKLCFLSVCNGLFRLSVIYRKKAITSAYQGARDHPAKLESLLEALKAAIDQGDYQRGEDLIARLSRSCWEKTYLEKLNWFNSLIMGNRVEASDLAWPLLSNLDQDYAKYIEGKSIAVVGPAPSGEETAADIDAHDVVVRFKYRGKNYLADSKEFGTRVNVSYYNNHVARTISELENHDFFDHLDYVVFKDIKFTFQKNLQKNHRVRIMFSPDDFFFLGSSNISPQVLYDLLHYRPSKIKVFKVNFYLSEKVHYQGYKHKPVKKTSSNYMYLWNEFAIHNPLTQLNFTRNLWHSGQIEVDHACEAVLRLSDEKYMSKLEDIYVKKPMNIL